MFSPLGRQTRFEQHLHSFTLNAACINFILSLFEEARRPKLEPNKREWLAAAQQPLDKIGPIAWPKF